MLMSAVHFAPSYILLPTLNYGATGSLVVITIVHIICVLYMCCVYVCCLLYHVVCTLHVCVAECVV